MTTNPTSNSIFFSSTSIRRIYHGVETSPPFWPHTTHAFVRGTYGTVYTEYICVPFHICIRTSTYIPNYRCIRTYVYMYVPSPIFSCLASPWKRKITGNAKSIVAIREAPSILFLPPVLCSFSRIFYDHLSFEHRT